MAQTKRNPPFRAEHLGSLLRPKDFLAQRAAFEKNEISQADMTAAEDESITKVVKVQTDIGFRAVTDGEYRFAIPDLPHLTPHHHFRSNTKPDARYSGAHFSRNLKA